MAEESVKTLNLLMNAKKKPETIKVGLPTELVIRESCQPRPLK
jgi:DNA-binding LacI/PurR family transcriptional regulator